MSIEPAYVVMDMGTFVLILWLMAVSIGLLLTRAVKDVLAWHRWWKNRYLSRPAPIDAWKLRIPKNGR